MSTTYPREFRVPIHPDHLRSLANPFNHDTRVIHAYVKVADFPHGKLPDDINPRRHDRNLQRIQGRIPEAILESLRKSPESFHLLNRGLLILADRAWYDNKSNMLHITISSPDHSGLADGATTDRVLANVKNSVSNAEFETLQEEEIPDYLKQAFVHLEVISPLGEEMIVPLTEARNTSMMVKEFALIDLGKGYEKIKDTLDESEFKGKIRYRENDVQPVDIRTILAIMTLFHPKWAEVKKEPTIAYSSKGAVLDYYQDEEWIKGYKQLCPVLVDILKFHDYVHVKFEEAYRKAFGSNGKVGGNKEVQTGTHVLPLTGAKVDYRLPDGWMFPLIASFRPLLDVKNGNRTVRWIQDPQTAFDQMGPELIEDIVEMSKQLGRNPNAVGKLRGLWSSLRAKVELYKNQLGHGDMSLFQQS